MPGRPRPGRGRLEDTRPDGLADGARGSRGLPRYTLTAFGDRIYARMGQPPARSPTMNRMGIGIDGTSASFSSPSTGRPRGKMLWKREAVGDRPAQARAEGGNRNAGFEGTPVADARNVYVAMTDRVEMTATYVACLDAETGATRWVRYICEANANVDLFLGGRPSRSATDC